jgi:F420-dependent oxidoreductase-like protein
VWVADLPNVAGLSALSVLAAASSVTSRVSLGSYVLPVYLYAPSMLAHQALSMQVLSQDRFVLGIGLSHRFAMADMLGFDVSRPIGYLREYLAVLNPLLDGRPAHVDGEFFNVHFEPAITDVSRPPLLVAALGPQMLRLAGELTDGTGLTFAGLRYIEGTVVPILTDAAARAGRPAPRIGLALPVSITAHTEDARQAAYRIHPFENVPSYRRLLDAEGLHDVRELAVVGDEATVSTHLDRLVALGVTDLICLQLRFDADPGATERTWAFLLDMARNLKPFAEAEGALDP